jgi:hypothetical protein
MIAPDILYRIRRTTRRFFGFFAGVYDGTGALNGMAVWFEEFVSAMGSSGRV